MKLLSLMVYKWKEDSSIEVAVCLNLQAFNLFQRGTVKEHIRFHSRLCVSRTAVGRKQTIDMDMGKCHTWVHPQGLGVAVLVDNEYPMRVAFGLLSETVRIFLEKMAGKWESATQDMDLGCPEIQELFQKYQNPSEADKMSKIQQDLDEVKGQVMQSMDDLLKRGENLDQLMEKSKDLSNTSVQFYRQAKKNNQCCKMY